MRIEVMDGLLPLCDNHVGWAVPTNLRRRSRPFVGMAHPIRFILTIAILCVGSSVAAFADTTEVLYLSGHGKDDPVKWGFFCTAGRNSGHWTTIPVPSNWELQGFGTYNYGGEHDKSDEQGKYRRTFTIPDGWSDKRIFIVFEGVMTDTEVLVNGRSAGPKHQGGFYRFKYEITDLLQPGENLLEVNVSKVSADPSVEQAERQADYWVFGGIYRPVFLEAVPKEFIDWVAIDARADGTFRVDIHAIGITASDTATADIIGPDGTKLGQCAVGKIETGQELVSLSAHVSGQKSWTAETPNLYTATISLCKGDQPIHTVSQPFGFRTFEVRLGDGLYLNGQKIVLKGVCRHSFWPDSGRCLSKQINYDDVRLIKQMNMNAVRMSHYPQDRDFLNACDELGLYVLDELAGWQKPPYDTEVGEKLIKETVTRDVCHPSILFWDNGNEGGWNPDLDDQFALYDPQKRTVLHPWENFGGIDTDHYETYESTLRKLASGTLFMPTEFLHGLYDGGLGAGLDDYWNATLASPTGAGGFLWALLDEGVARTDRNGEIDVAGNQAPDGIVGPYRQKEGSFYTIKEIFSPIYIAMDKVPLDFDGKIEVENRYDFTNLDECKFEVRLMTFATPGDLDTVSTSQTSMIAGPVIAPHDKGILDLALPESWPDAEALLLTALDPKGEEVWTWSWDLQEINYYRHKCVTTDQGAGITAHLVAGEDHIQIQAGDTILGFSATGRLVHVTADGKPIAFSGPTLIPGTMQPSKFTIGAVGDAIALEGEYEGDMRRVSWTVYPTGWVRLDYEFALEGQFDLFGISFDYPEEKVKGMRRLGRGPYRVWKNRMKGGRLGLWNNRYKNDIPGVTWDFPEFKGYYRDWRWVVFRTQEGDITVINDTEDLFLGVYRPNDGPVPANTKLDVPDTGIAFLHGIPPIGTKFHTPDVLGPRSQKNKASGSYRGTLWLHFAALKGDEA
jgi:hypothetical protein